MPSIRKRPTPADNTPEPEAQVAVLEPAQPPPVVEHQPAFKVACPGIIFDARTPEEIIHNVMVRQLRRDEENPPGPPPAVPSLQLLRDIQTAKDTGQPLEPFVEQATKVFQGLDAQERLVSAVVRDVELRQLTDKLETEVFLNDFFKRMVRNGDLTTREAIVVKQMNCAELRALCDNLRKQLVKETPEVAPTADITKMDYTLHVSEQTLTRQFENTTPAGREIIRKITLHARKQLFKANVPK